MAELNPEDFNWFRTERRRVNNNYALGASQNQYAQETAANAYGRDRGSLVQKYAQMREGLPGGYANRGLLNSGVWQKAQTDFATQQDQALTDQQGAYQDQLGGLKLGMGQLETSRTNGLNDLTDQETARRAQIAAMLRAAGVGY